MKYLNWVGMLPVMLLVAGTAVLAESEPRLPFLPNAPVVVRDRNEVVSGGTADQAAVGQGENGTADGLAMK